MATGEWQPKHKTESTATLVAAGGSHSSTDKWTIHSAEAVCDSGGGKAARGRGRCLSASGGCERRGAMPTSDEGKWLTAGVIHSSGPSVRTGRRHAPRGGRRQLALWQVSVLFLLGLGTNAVVFFQCLCLCFFSYLFIYFVLFSFFSFAFCCFHSYVT